jgi:hypothetical protein
MVPVALAFQSYKHFQKSLQCSTTSVPLFFLLFVILYVVLFVLLYILLFVLLYILLFALLYILLFVLLYILLFVLLFVLLCSTYSMPYSAYVLLFVLPSSTIVRTPRFGNENSAQKLTLSRYHLNELQPSRFRMAFRSLTSPKSLPRRSVRLRKKKR